MKVYWVVSTVLAFAAVSHGLNPINVQITCDNELWFYADGVAIVDETTRGYNDWTATNQVQVPGDTKVFGIKCVDQGYIAGILASFSDDTVTDGNWRCTAADPGGPGWLYDTYDDSAWSPAHSIHENSGTVRDWGVRSDISSDAEWIWTTGWHEEDMIVYCRKVIQEHIKGEITCDNELSFYADGKAIVDSSTTDYDNWAVTKNVEVPADTKVYGIKCVDKGVIAGILASFDDRTITDGNWRCTNIDPGSSWLTEAFDDSAWHPAHKIYQNTGDVPAWSVQREISDQAEWIWTTGWNGEDNTVWCRKFVEEHIDVDITCDNELWFYADGKAMIDTSTAAYANWQVTKHVEVPADTRVYGIKCVDMGVVAGILASFSDGTVTDKNWRCTRRDPGSSWLSEAFDDSTWQSATSIFQNTEYVPAWSVQAEISDRAEWIWTTGWNGEDKTVWCRKFVEYECPRHLEDWSEAGCVWDKTDNCIPFDKTLNCGWGLKRHYYFCGPNDDRHCTYKCYKPCVGVSTPDCSSVDTSQCSMTRKVPCSSKCGVGNTILEWSCPNNVFARCTEQCCCERCTASAASAPASDGASDDAASSEGSRTFNICNDTNMALPMSDYAGMCPHHIFGLIPA